MPRTLLTAVLALALLTLIGCGDGDGDGESKGLDLSSVPAGSGSPATDTPQPAPAEPADAFTFSEEGQQVEAMMKELVEVLERLQSQMEKVQDPASAQRIAAAVRDDYARFNMLLDQISETPELPAEEKAKIDDRYGERFKAAFGGVIGHRMRIQSAPELDPPFKNMLDELEAEQSNPE